MTKTDKNNSNLKKLFSYKRELILYICVYVILAVYYVINFFIHRYYPFGYKNFIDIHLKLGQTRLIYILSIILTPFFILICQQVLNKYLPASKKILRIHTIIAVGAGVGLMMSIAKLNLELFYKWNPYKLLLYTSLKTHLITLFVIFLIYKYHLISRTISESSLVKRINFVSIITIIVISLFLANFTLLSDYSRYNTNTLNLGAVLHSVVQVFYGKALLVNLKSQYGLYAHFLEPIFHLFGGISIFKFSLIMATLVFFSLLSIGIFLYRLTKNKMLSLIGFLAVVYFEYFLGVLWPSELYFQYTPIRTIFPTLLLILSYSYFTLPTSRKLYSILIFLSAGMLWNLDVGLFAWLAFVSALVYRELLHRTSISERAKNIFLNISIAISIAVSVLAIFIGYIKIRYGAWPILQDFTWAQWLYRSGSALQPFHLWTMIILTYIVGMILSIYHMVHKEYSIRNIFIFLLTVLGCGLFTYHLANAHDSTLTQSGYPAVILLVIFIDSLLFNSSPQHFINKIYTFAGLFILSFLAVCFFFNVNQNIEVTDVVSIENIMHPNPTSKKALWEIRGPSDTETAYIYEGDMAKSNKPIPPWILKANFINKYANKNGRITDDMLILSTWDYYLYLKAKARAPIISVDLWLIYYMDEWKSLYQLIKEKKTKFVVVDNEWGFFQGVAKIHENYLIERLLVLIDRYYTKTDSKQIGYSYYAGKWYPGEMIIYERK